MDFGELGMAGDTFRVKKKNTNGGMIAMIQAMAFIFCKQILFIANPHITKRAAFKMTHI